MSLTYAAIVIESGIPFPFKADKAPKPSGKRAAEARKNRGEASRGGGKSNC